MRKTKRFIITLLITIALYSCSNDTNNKIKNDDIVGKDEKNTKNVQSEVKSVVIPVWQIEQVTDEFGDKVEGETAVVANFKGKMSNSAVSGADMTVRMRIFKSTIITDFFEYNREPHAKLPESEYIKIKLKLSSGDVLEVSQFLGIDMMCDYDKKLLEIILSQNMPIKVIVDLSKANEYASGTYNFEIDPTGLKDILKQVENTTADSLKQDVKN